jgi:hypothetical protein
MRSGETSGRSRIRYGNSGKEARMEKWERTREGEAWEKDVFEVAQEAAFLMENRIYTGDLSDADLYFVANRARYLADCALAIDAYLARALGERLWTRSQLWRPLEQTQEYKEIEEPR